MKIGSIIVEITFLRIKEEIVNTIEAIISNNMRVRAAVPVLVLFMLRLEVQSGSRTITLNKIIN